LATIAVGFWVACFTTTPQNNQLFWVAIAFSLVFAFSFGVAIYYRKKVYRGSLIKATTLAEFKTERK